MKTSTLSASALFAFALSVAALGIGATVESPATLMSPIDYHASRQAIEAETRLAIARCRAAQPEARELCRAEARARDRVRHAELEARYHGTVSAGEAADRTRREADRQVARVRCSGRLGAERGACLAARG